jgi:hypothetical protein
VSRRSPRFRVQLSVTVTPMIGAGEMAVCLTRDVSDAGLWLDTAMRFDEGTKLVLQMMDTARGAVVEVVGVVTRQSQGGFGVRILDATDDWKALVAAAARRAAGGNLDPKPTKRLRVLVVGDDQRQRGALALYVTSGWDVRFANDLDTTGEALRGVKLDAVIAEHDADDERWPPILAEARQRQPAARRIVRGTLKTSEREGDASKIIVDPTLVHRFVDRDAGLDALLDALTADLPAAS